MAITGWSHAVSPSIATTPSVRSTTKRYDTIWYGLWTTLTTLHETTSCVWWRQEPGQKSRSVSRSSAGHLSRLESDSPIPGWWCQLKNVSQLGSYLHYVTIHIIIYNYIYICVCCRRKFRSQTSDNMERWKAEQGRGREKRKIRREKIRRERVRRQKIQMREKVGKSRNTVFFQWFVAPEGRKVGSLKRRVRSQLATGAMKNCAPLWREAHFEVKSVKNWPSRTTFGSWDVKKVHAVVARSTFPSQNVQNTRGFGPLLEVAMSKKCTPLWREAHFQVKMYKTPGVRTTFGSCDVGKSARRCGAKHISKSKCTKH